MTSVQLPPAGQTTEFALPAGGSWTEVKVTLPIDGAMQHLRLYLPAEKEGVEVDWIELAPATGPVRRWDF